ncbi:MAG: aspartate/glutamate racemase family protein [Treponema sp.]|jgi:glutamate racemase|nr:aspartate/glutamate racemase family protein [Treponema sp.]
MGTVLFLDSGLGGLPYCRRFLLRNPRSQAVYLADRAAFPYGSKTREELTRLLTGHFTRLIPLFNPALAALVCNTASVSCLAELRKRFPSLPFVGTVPAVKPAVRASRLKSVGILGTERTIADPYIDELARRYGPDCAIRKIAAPELVEFVERRCRTAGDEERRRTAASYVEQFRGLGCDCIVLGCTHFLFLLEEFRAAAGAALTVYDSMDGVCGRIEGLLNAPDAKPQGGSRSGQAALSGGVSGLPLKTSLLLLTGEEEIGPSWKACAEDFGLEPRLLEDMGGKGR